MYSRAIYPPASGDPALARAYEEGILDASFGQVISFASYYQTSFRIEVPLWHKVEEGITRPGQEHQGATMPELAKPVLRTMYQARSPAVRPLQTQHRVQTNQLRMQMRKRQKKKLTFRLLDRDATLSR